MPARVLPAPVRKACPGSTAPRRGACGEARAARAGHSLPGPLRPAHRRLVRRYAPPLYTRITTHAHTCRPARGPQAWPPLSMHACRQACVPWICLQTLVENLIQFYNFSSSISFITHQAGVWAVDMPEHAWLAPPGASRSMGSAGVRESGSRVPCVGIPGRLLLTPGRSGAGELSEQAPGPRQPGHATVNVRTQQAT